jgi:hypothetical protein
MLCGYSVTHVHLVSYSLYFIPALVGTHLSLFGTYTVLFVPLIHVLPGFYIRLGL